jgi:hypothetical protein
MWVNRRKCLIEYFYPVSCKMTRKKRYCTIPTREKVRGFMKKVAIIITTIVLFTSYSYALEETDKKEIVMTANLLLEISGDLEKIGTEMFTQAQSNTRDLFESGESDTKKFANNSVENFGAMVIRADIMQGALICSNEYVWLRIEYPPPVGDRCEEYMLAINFLRINRRTLPHLEKILEGINKHYDDLDDSELSNSSETARNKINEAIELLRIVERVLISNIKKED